MPSWAGERPAEMLQRGRPVREDFRPNDELYYRLAPHQVADGSVTLDVGQLQPPFNFPRFSVNWSRFSKPAWVLIPPASEPEKSYEGFSVGAVFVSGIPRRTAGMTPKPVHVPELYNYSHSEIRCYDDAGNLSTGTKITRKKLRILLGREVRVLEHGEVHSPSSFSRFCSFVLRFFTTPS